MDEPFLQKLRALGVEVGTKSIAPPVKRGTSLPIDHVMDGRELTTQYGSIFISEQLYPINHQHGNTSLSNNSLNFTTFFEWAGNSGLSQTSLENILFLDTETSGLSGGTGTFAFMVGLGYWDSSGFKIIQLFLRDLSEEPAMLASLIEIASSFAVVVTFNGKSFDIPLLNTRYVINGLSSPFKEIFHIDLLMLSRRIWRNRLASRALGSLETEILSFARSEEEIPGWLIPDLYFDYLKTRNAYPLKGVFYHNNKDVLSMAVLLSHLADLLENPLEYNPKEGLDLIAIAQIFENLNRLEDAVHLYEFSLGLGLPRHFFIQTLYRYANIRKKSQAWNAAIQLWTQASQYGEFGACIEIAKFHEHKSKNIEEALAWTNKAIICFQQAMLPPYIRRQKNIELEGRLKRLQTKLKKESKNG